MFSRIYGTIWGIFFCFLSLMIVNLSGYAIADSEPQIVSYDKVESDRLFDAGLAAWKNGEYSKQSQIGRRS